jgi:prepilin-type N-terminal cleavage/methylation domain-containing protein
MWIRRRSYSQSGYSLVEVLLVLAVLGVCFALGAVSLAHGIGTVEARGAAQSWQAAAAWAQAGAMWQGEDVGLRYDSGRLSADTSLSAGAGDLGSAAPVVPVVANLVRWRAGLGVVVRFLGGSAHPDGAGSLYFQAPLSSYRVTVRLESGLTTRIRVVGTP